MHANEPEMAKEWEKKKKMKKETKVRELIRKMVREIMSEGKRRQLKIPIRDKLKVNKILKKLKYKIGKDYDIGVGKPGTFILDIDNKKLNKALDIFIVNRIQVREGFAGALKKEDRKSFDKMRQKQSEVLGYKLMGTPDVKVEIDDATIKEGLDLKKLETAIKDFQKKIKKQGRVTNARDEDHLKQLIKVYKQMGGRKIREAKKRDYKA